MYYWNEIKKDSTEVTKVQENVQRIWKKNEEFRFLDKNFQLHVALKFEFTRILPANFLQDVISRPEIIKSDVNISRRKRWLTLWNKMKAYKHVRSCFPII